MAPTKTTPARNFPTMMSAKRNRQRQENFIGTRIQFFRKEPHGDGRHHKGKCHWKQVEKIAHIGLVEDKKGREKQPARYQEEDRYNDIGDGRDEEIFQLFAHDVGHLMHVSSPWSVL